MRLGVSSHTDGTGRPRETNIWGWHMFGRRHPRLLRCTRLVGLTISTDPRLVSARAAARQARAPLRCRDMEPEGRMQVVTVEGLYFLPNGCFGTDAVRCQRLRTASELPGGPYRRHPADDGNLYTQVPRRILIEHHHPPHLRDCAWGDVRSATSYHHMPNPWNFSRYLTQIRANMCAM